MQILATFFRPATPLTYHSLHGVCLSWGRLAVRENGSVVPGQHIRYDRLGRLIEDLLLGRIRLEHLVEEVHFALGRGGGELILVSVLSSLSPIVAPIFPLCDNNKFDRSRLNLLQVDSSKHKVRSSKSRMEQQRSLNCNIKQNIKHSSTWSTVRSCRWGR